MSAFAAILAVDGERPAAQEELAAVSAVLASITGEPVRRWREGACELLSTPVHSWEARQPITLDTGSQIAAAGQVTLEGRDDLTRTLRLPTDAPDLQVAAAAYHRWGTEFARHLRGEYACAMWDGRERRLTCARDPLGIRPLYAGSSARRIVVSNVIDAVVAHPDIPDDVDDAALARFLAQGTLTSSTATPYRAVQMVPEAHTLTIHCSGKARLIRHWRPAAFQRARERSDDFVLSGYREVLRQAVEARIANRASTIFLSGGMDSTSLAAVAVECGSSLRAVTFAYRRLDVNGEVALARTVAERLSIPLDIVEADADVALEAERKRDVAALPIDEPFLTNWRAGLRAAASFSTLAIYGEDGDALFTPPGGWTLWKAQPFRSVLRGTIRTLAVQRRLPYLGIRLRERLGLSEAITGVPTPWLTPDALRLASAPEEATILGQAPDPLPFDAGNGRAWERVLNNVPRSLAITLSPDVTRQRLMITLPLMDTRVIDFVMSVPPIPWCQDKYLARAAFAGRLPSSVVTRSKTPATGLDTMLVCAWRDTYLERAPDSMTRAMRSIGWIDVPRWLDAVSVGSPKVTMAAWRVLLLEAWLSRASPKVAPCTT